MHLHGTHLEHELVNVLDPHVEKVRKGQSAIGFEGTRQQARLL